MDYEITPLKSQYCELLETRIIGVTTVDVVDVEVPIMCKRRTLHVHVIFPG